jgi:hypothetical protein
MWGGEGGQMMYRAVSGFTIPLRIPVCVSRAEATVHGAVESVPCQCHDVCGFIIELKGLNCAASFASFLAFRRATRLWLDHSQNDCKAVSRNSQLSTIRF